MNLWFIVLTILVLAMVVGPIMMFKPSKRDQRLAALRQAAAQKGLGVRLVPTKHHNSKHAVAVYSSYINEPKTSDNPDEVAEVTPLKWVLLKQSFEHGVHFYGYWDWQDSNAKAPVADHVTLKSLLDELDETFVGLELTDIGVGLWWTEKSHGIEDVYSLLSRIKEKLIKGKSV